MIFLKTDKVTEVAHPVPYQFSFLTNDKLTFALGNIYRNGFFVWDTIDMVPIYNHTTGSAKTLEQEEVPTDDYEG